jgi:valyl-tRNA synthetase
LTDEDKKNITENLNEKVVEITKYMNDNRLDLASEKIYLFVWHYFADQLIEESKSLLASEDSAIRNSRKLLLERYLIDSLKILHPFMPFVTETIWQELPKNMKDADMLIVAKWPTV